MTATKTTTKKATPAKAEPTPTKKAAPKSSGKSTAKYNVAGYPGLARTVRSRLSGTQLSIWFTAEAPQFKGASKPWAIECEDHGKSKLCDTRTEARMHREDPVTFCPTCKAAFKRTSKKAA